MEKSSIDYQNEIEAYQRKIKGYEILSKSRFNIFQGSN